MRAGLLLAAVLLAGLLSCTFGGGTLTVNNFTSQTAEVWGVLESDPWVASGQTRSFSYDGLGAVGASAGGHSQTIEHPGTFETISLY